MIRLSLLAVLLAAPAFAKDTAKPVLPTKAVPVATSAKPVVPIRVLPPSAQKQVPTAAPKASAAAKASAPVAVTHPHRHHPKAPPNARSRGRGAKSSLPVRAANRAALRPPTRHGFVNAIQIYPYAPGALYQLYAAPERVSDITLGTDESLIAVAAGDTVRWVVGDTTSGSGATKRTHILVKPSAPGLHTNLIITTSQRSYHLDLISTAGAAMAALSWEYPQGQLLALQRSEAQAEAAAPIASGLAIDRLNFAYTISGDKPDWRPIRAFDDGTQAFIEFPETLGVGEAPPLFVIGTDGGAELVNYRVRGNYYIVDRLFDAAELRLGTKHQQSVRISSETARKSKKARGQ